MKYTLHTLAVSLFVFLLSSCKTTAISVSTIEPIQVHQQVPKMDFLGFQNMKRQDFFTQDFGNILATNNIADNKQDYYLGEFDLADLSNYKSNHKYISFINVERQYFGHSDAIADNNDMYLAGWIIALSTIFTLFPVYVPLMCAYKKNVCEISCKAEYVLYVYDTNMHQICDTRRISINECDRMEGQYSHRDTDRKQVNLHYKTIIQNKLLEAFASIYQQLP